MLNRTAAIMWSNKKVKETQYRGGCKKSFEVWKPLNVNLKEKMHFRVVFYKNLLIAIIR